MNHFWSLLFGCDSVFERVIQRPTSQCLCVIAQGHFGGFWRNDSIQPAQICPSPFEPFANRQINAAASFRLYSDGYDEEESNGEVQSLILQGKLRAGLWYDLEHPVPLEKITSAYDSLRRHEALKYLTQL